MANETTRPDKMNRLYKSDSGEVTKQLLPDVAGVVFEIIETGARVELDLGDLFPDGLPGPCVGRQAAAFGLNTAVGNTVGNTRDPHEMLRRLQERAETISDGEWSSGREGGPRGKYVLEAWRLSLEDRGHKVTDESFEKMRKAVADGVVTTKDMLADEQVNARYLAEEVKRKAAQADAAAQAAKGKDASEINPLLLPK